jgi:hypothetical protein
MAVNKATFTMIGIGPILYGRPVHEERIGDETHEQLKERTWKEKAAVDGDNMLCIPAEAVRRSLIFAGSWLSMKLTGNKTFTKRFMSGMMCNKPMFQVIKNGSPIHFNELDKSGYRLDLFVPPDGKKGGKSRVWRAFPRILPSWEVKAEFLVTDDAIDLQALEAHVRSAGLHDGIGSMRIGQGGPNGMWDAKDVSLVPYTF